MRLTQWNFALLEKIGIFFSEQILVDTFAFVLGLERSSSFSRLFSKKSF
jgi:hypothetical protein